MFALNFSYACNIPSVHICMHPPCTMCEPQVTSHQAALRAWAYSCVCSRGSEPQTRRQSFVREAGEFVQRVGGQIIKERMRLFLPLRSAPGWGMEQRKEFSERSLKRASFQSSSSGAHLLLLAVGMFLLGCQGAAGQTVRLTNAVVPPSETLRHDPNPFYIFGANVKFVFPKEAVGKQNKVVIKNLRLSKTSSDEIRQVIAHDVLGRQVANTEQAKLLNISPAGVEVALIKFRQLKRMLSGGAPVPLCCHGMPFGSDHPFVPTAECPYPNAFRRYFWSDKNIQSVGGGSQHQQTSDQVLEGEKSVPIYDGEEVYVRPVALDGTPEAQGETAFVVRDSDIYFLITANCGPLSDLTYEGEIYVTNAYGSLPGFKYSGLVSDLICVVAYAFLTLVWGGCLLRHRRNLIPFHYCLGGVAFLGMLECAAELWSLYQWNISGPSKLPLCVTIGLSVLKNISAYVLVLLGALGWSITRPSLEKKTVSKIQLIVLTYIVFDSLRQVSNAYDTSGTFSLLRSLVVLLPISILNVIVFYWIFSALHENIELLTREKQYEKLLIYRRLFIVLFGGLFLATGILIVQLYAAALDPSDRWQHQAILTEGLPRLLFLLLVACMMLIWRPHIHSKRLAYFTEIGDTDEIDHHRARRDKTSPGPQVWGEELDFHDHFSEEDFDEDGAAHLRLENDIPTFASVQVAFPGRPAEAKVANGGGASSFSSKANPAASKAQRAPADSAAANEQQQTGIEMGGSHVVRASPASHEEAPSTSETQVIGRPNFAQPLEGDPAQASADPEKAEL
ncbi:hypothetical protein Emag_001025 [Eimeria magna]